MCIISFQQLVDTAKAECLILFAAIKDYSLLLSASSERMYQLHCKGSILKRSVSQGGLALVINEENVDTVSDILSSI